MADEVLKLAESGDEEGQLKLGKHYLTLADTGSEDKRVENGKLGTRWLIEASRQGNEEATKKLQECLKTGTGVDASNREDIEWCTETSYTEKKIRYAAKGLFKSLNDTHSEVMSKADYVEAVKKFTGGDILEEKLLLAAGKKIGDQINETEFVKVLSKKIQGQITLTSSEVSDKSEGYKKAGIIEKAIKYPRETASALFDVGLETVSKEGMSWVTSLIPTNQIYLLSVFFLYSFISTRLLFLLVPLVVFYIAMGIMCVTTLQMFYKKRKQREAAHLANALKKYDVGLNVEETKSQYTWNSLTPYIVYFGALPLLIVSFSLANKLYIPCSEFCVLAGILSGVCFTALSDSYDLITLLAMGCSVLSALPTFLHHFPQIPVLTAALTFVCGSPFSIDCGAGFKINFGIPSLAYVIVPLFFVVMAAQKSWQGVYRVLIPHLVCYFWFHLMLSFFPFSTWKGLIRASVGYVLLPLLMPIILLLIFIGALYAVYKLFQTAIFGKLFITLLLGSVPILLTQTKMLLGKQMEKKIRSVKVIVMVIFGVLALIPVIFIKLPSAKSVSTFEMTPEEYVSFCGPGAGNTAPYQMKCNHIQGQKVTWSGELIGAKVTKISNYVEPLMSGLPSFLTDQLRCIYGTEFGDCDKIKSEVDRELCTLMKSLGHDCHLKGHDTYNFAIQVKLEGFDGTVILDAGDSYKNTIVALQAGDTIKFTGNLVDGLGTSSLGIKLKQLSCTSRELDVMMEMEEEDPEEILMREMNGAIAVAFNFFWYPLVEYSP
ncbi:hypothetical protein FSP39_012288 [Pinctada imbricata]|uniref:Wolframin n=1 Tax=Pinctada imbricata TaxID=66713 RepID=A0AA89CAL4_PINIB|nr:hypothetical protein FSP39_012288 [Pinctada imbricata]